MKFREFWKTYSREIEKLLTTHFALAIFSILSTSAFLLIQTESTKNLLCVLICILVFVFYYYLVRTQMWNLGARDRLTANGGRMKLNRLTGLYLGLLASVPSLIVNLIYLISYTYRDYAAFQTLHSVFACIELIWDAQAMGLRLATGSPYAYLTASILPALFAGLAYFLGTNEWSLFGHKKTEN